MKPLFYCVFVLCLALGAMNKSYAQKNDYIWLTGYDAYPSISYDSIDSVYFATTRFDFNYLPVQLSADSLQMNFDATGTMYSDDSGDLLFYTNGIYIANALNDTVANSDSLNFGWEIYAFDPSIQTYGYREPQGVLVFQDVNGSNKYYLLQGYNDSVGGEVVLAGTRTLATLVDMDENAGQGNVVYKNQTIVEDKLATNLSATRHGNGRDWWVLVQKRDDSSFYRILLDENGPHALPELTGSGPNEVYGDISVSCFSPDGSKYAYLSPANGLRIYDFDRCTGMLSNLQILPLPVIDDSIWLGIGVAISPNSRYLYVSLTAQLYQLDLWNSNIFSAIDTVGRYDGYQKPFGTAFNVAQMGPDGKIYIDCGSSVPVYHVINNPDLPGDSCNFVQHGVQLAGYAIGIPNFPNYRLGALIGSDCDTITGLSEVARVAKETVLKVFPNPATDLVTVDYGFTDWSKTGAVSLEIVNALGQTVYAESLPQYSGYQRLDVTKYATGVYTAFIKRNEQVIAVQKFAKE